MVPEYSPINNNSFRVPKYILSTDLGWGDELSLSLLIQKACEIKLWIYQWKLIYFIDPFIKSIVSHLATR